MAIGKKSFVFYTEWIEIFNTLSDDEAGKLIKHVLKYVNDLNPEAEDRLTEIAFIPIKQALKRDLKKYENYIEKQKANGKKGGRPKTQKTQAFLEKPKKADNVNDNVNVSTEVDMQQINLWIKEISNSPTYLEGLYRLNKLKKGSISELLNTFKEHLKVYPEEHVNFSDFKKHFSNWLNILNNKKKLVKYQSQTKGQL